MTDAEINKCFEEVMFDPNSEPSREAIGRAIIAAHTAKLLSGVEMPEPEYPHLWVECGGTETQAGYTADQLQQYAAAAAAQARMKALDEAMQAAQPDDSYRDQWFEAKVDACKRIESLKGKQA